MYLTGFADEAGDNLLTQIKATKEIGWNQIESRKVQIGDHPMANLHDISDAAFDEAAQALSDAGVSVNCFGSTIANWAKHIDQAEDASLEEAKRAIPRMQKLGSKLIRIMSYAVRKENGPESQMIDERVRRLNEIVPLFIDAGLQPVHENCMNYGGMGAEYSLRLLEAVPGLKLVFDTGNPVFTDDKTKPQPYPKQNPWEFYCKVKDHIAYVHIKDGIWLFDDNKVQYTYPGEGQGDVRAIVKDLLDNGYDGGISMEPHLAAVFHEPNSSADAKAQVAYDTYVEYGKRFNQLLADIGHPAS